MATQTLLVAVPASALTVANPGANAPTNGQIFAIPNTAGEDITWDITASGTALGAMQVDLQGCLDSTFANAAQLDTTSTVGSQVRHVTNKQMPFLRVRLVSASGGDATSQIVCRVYIKKRGADL